MWRPRRLPFIALLSVLCAGLFLWLVVTPRAAAAQLQFRSMTIASPAASATTTHSFQFNSVTAANLGSIQFAYCDTPLFGLTCNAPSGVNVSGATLTSQNGETGFSILSQINNIITISRPIATLANPATLTYTFSNVVNPSAVNATAFVRITTYASTDASGSYTDYGAVAFSTTTGLGIGVFVPPYLTFCVGVTVSVDCSSMNGNFIDLGELSSTVARSATSQFSTATNGVSGYVVSIHGTTMTSGNNVLPASTIGSPSTPGMPQFGINLRTNTNPVVGQDPVGASTGVASPPYNTPNQFAFVPDSTLVSSPIASDFTLFTISYITNIANNQAPGFYTTTTTLIATATF